MIKTGRPISNPIHTELRILSIHSSNLFLYTSHLQNGDVYIYKKWWGIVVLIHTLLLFRQALSPGQLMPQICDHNQDNKFPSLRMFFVTNLVCNICYCTTVALSLNKFGYFHQWYHLCILYITPSIVFFNKWFI